MALSGRLRAAARCGTVPVMPNKLDDATIKEADAAVRFAQQVRSRHRRRTSRGSGQREEDIALALERLRDAMKPLRSEIGRFTYGPVNDIAEANRQRIRESSAAIQRERRKLWKMKGRTP